MNKEMIKIIRDHILREGMSLDESIVYIIELEGGKKDEIKDKE